MMNGEKLLILLGLGSDGAFFRSFQYKYFNQILNRDVNFNFLGQSEDSIKKVSEHGLFVQVKFSVR